MGVPAFFRWISEKYRGALKVIPHYDDIEGACDWLHLDLNALIHPCTHPEFGPQPKTDEERFQGTCEYIETMIKLSKPRVGLFIAMDGVAPVAKMQQQRIRRYRAVEMKKMSKTRFSKLLEYLDIDPKDVKQDPSWDYNVITPGTPFMDGLAKALREYFHKQLETSELWTHLQVILSDSNEPGEGEHKIMRFLRSLRSRNYDMDQQHIIFSPDADMIPLLLCSHLPKVKVLRPRVAYKQKDRKCDMCWEKGHPTFMCSRNPVPLNKKLPAEDYWTFDLGIVREYLSVELFGNKNEFERAVEDFVFLTFLVGNDFLHHLPGFGIRDGAIDLLMNVWNSFRKKNNHMFLTNTDGSVNWKALGKFFYFLAPWENKVFAYANKQTAIRNKIRSKKKREDEEIALRRESNRQQMVLDKAAAKRFIAHNQDREVREKMRNQKSANPQRDAYIKSLKENKDPRIQELEAQFPNMDWTGVNVSWFLSLELMQKKKFLSRLARRVPDHLRPPDKIQYGTKDWKKRYYKEKFKFDVENAKVLKQQVEEQTYKVLVGLQWNYSYYRSGCPSWTWGYASAYSPAVTDIVEVFKNFDISRVLGAKPPQAAPIDPFVQLMCVLPPGTVCKGYALPKPLQDLVCDENSEVSDLFHRIKIMNDYEHAFEHWQAISQVPFPEVKRIEEQAQKLYPQCPKEDMVRNVPHEAKLFVFTTNPLVDCLDSGTNSQNSDILPFNVLFADSCPDEMNFVDQHVNGFIKVVQKDDNVFSCLYRPFMYIEDPSIIQSIPRPQNILTAKQIQNMRRSRRYGTFDMNFTVRPPRKRRNRKHFNRRQQPVQDHWVPGRGSSPEFVDNLSSEEENVSPKSPDKEAVLEGLEFLDIDDDNKKSRNKRKKQGKPDPKGIPATIPNKRNQNRRNQPKNNPKKFKNRKFKPKTFNTEEPKSKKRRGKPARNQNAPAEPEEDDESKNSQPKDNRRKRRQKKNDSYVDSRTTQTHQKRRNNRRQNHLDDPRHQRPAPQGGPGISFQAQSLYSDLSFNNFTAEPRFANADHHQPRLFQRQGGHQFQDPRLFQNPSSYDSMYNQNSRGSTSQNPV